MFPLLASTIQFSNRHAPRAPAGPAEGVPRAPRMGIGTAPQSKTVGWRSGNPKAHPYHSRHPQGERQADDLFHTSIPTRDRGTVPRAWGTHRTRTVS